MEDWAAYWYLRVFPGRWEAFTESGQRTPRFEEMRQDIEAAHEKPKDLVVRDWMKRLHKYSHVDVLSVRIVLQVDDDGTVHYRLGPEPQEWPFRYTSSEAIAIIGVLLEAIDNFLRWIGRPTEVDPNGYLERVMHWQQAQVRSHPEHAEELADSMVDDS